MVVGYFIYLFVSVNLFLLSFVPKGYKFESYYGPFDVVEFILVAEFLLSCIWVGALLFKLIILSISQVIL